MKRIKRILFLLLLVLLSCEEVVDIDLEESDPRLVVEASLIWYSDESENPLYVRLTTTAPFFDEEIPPALGATVTVYSSTGTAYEFTEIEDGLFKHDGFIPYPNVTYELEILYNGEVYRASERFISTPPLESVEQSSNGGFTGDDIELKVFYTDPAGMDNYYLFRFFHEKLSLQINDDQFTDGSRTFVFFISDNMDPGDQVLFEIQGISEKFYEYLNILRSQAGTAGGPFQTQPTTVRGNVINISDPDNFPFGYFRLSESAILHYRIK